ncbi:hypothetical protein QE152_g13091 [Popillia japonica]|uniref:Polyprotein n=1 Tax=Popillia japonica TaxID=7064 RepID=A0AAW1LEV3_POPJA
MNATATPIERGMLTDEGNFVNDRPLSKSVPYREVIGSLLFAYLKGTINYGIRFSGASDLVAYTDSDYAGDIHTGHSTSGVLVMRGGPVVWYAQKQRLVATSTAEAEYRAAVSAIDDICWIRRLGRELKILKSDEPTTLYIDNQSAIHMLKNTHEGKIRKGKKHRYRKKIHSRARGKDRERRGKDRESAACQKL